MLRIGLSPFKEIDGSVENGMEKQARVMVALVNCGNINIIAKRMLYIFTLT